MKYFATVETWKEIAEMDFEGKRWRSGDLAKDWHPSYINKKFFVWETGDGLICGRIHLNQPLECIVFPKDEEAFMSCFDKGWNKKVVKCKLIKSVRNKVTVFNAGGCWYMATCPMEKPNYVDVPDGWYQIEKKRFKAFMRRLDPEKYEWSAGEKPLGYNPFEHTTKGRFSLYIASKRLSWCGITRKNRAVNVFRHEPISEEDYYAGKGAVYSDGLNYRFFNVRTSREEEVRFSETSERLFPIYKSIARPEEEHFEVTVRDREVRVTLNGKTGVAKCNPDDIFNLGVGVELAYRRAK